MRAVWDNRRMWLPFAASGLCLAATAWTGLLVTWVLIVAAFWLFFDGLTAVCSNAGSLAQHHQ
jgi:hypothetical protein